MQTDTTTSTAPRHRDIVRAAEDLIEDVELTPAVVADRSVAGDGQA